MAHRVRTAVLLLAALAAGGWPGGAGASPSQALIGAVRAEVARYQSPAAARAAGYVPASVTAPVEHWINPAYVSAGPLDPRHPAGLVYLETGSTLRLVAAMFMMASPADQPPAVAGATWHHHTWCQGPGGIGIPLPGGPCPGGTSLQDSPAMLHVWLADVPLPAFATDMAPSLVCHLGGKLVPTSA